MKILHTSDWHLGHSLYNYDRLDEQKAMLSQMVGIVVDEQPDVFLLCGDVYHTSQPSANVQTLFTEAIMEIHEACPSMYIIITAGNHDSGSKHEIFRTPWRKLQVFSIGNIEKEETSIDEHIIEIGELGYVIAVPYAHQRNISEGFFQKLLDRVSDMNQDNLPVVMTAHTTIKGSSSKGHDRATEFSVGGIDCMDLDEIGTGYDYLALGHIHHAQFISGSERRARYSGTPLPVSFDETYTHSVSIVDILEKGAVPIVRTVEIYNHCPLVTLPTEGTADWETAKQLLKDFPDDISAYIRLNVEVDDFLPADAHAEAVKLTIDKGCRFCFINVKRKEKQDAEGKKMLSVSEFQSEDPVEIARQYASDLGIVFDEEMEKLFMETLEQVNEEGRKD